MGAEVGSGWRTEDDQLARPFSYVANIIKGDKEMGEAKKRGTYEQRKEAAIKRQEALAEIQRCTAKANFRVPGFAGPKGENRIIAYLRVSNKALQLAITEAILLSDGGKPWLK
jgi:hypothetical protein